MRTIRLTVNGKAVTAAVEPRTHLADFLRESQLLTGTHLGCEHGVCGACTVLVDGRTARSCLLLAAQLEGAEVTTVEGSPVEIDATGSGVMVDDARVIQADIEADNGVIYPIDAVLVPQTILSQLEDQQNQQ